MANYELLRDSSFFTFLVGGQKDVFNIHSNVLLDLSEPLHSLITNTFLKEAQEKNACLEKEDTEVFTRFMEWAYTKLYRVRRNRGVTLRSTSAEAVAKSPVDKMLYGSLSRFSYTRCRNWCYVSDSVENKRSTFPFCIQFSAAHRFVGYNTTIQRRENPIYACKACSQKYNIDPIDLCATSSHRFEVFQSRAYPVADASHSDVRKLLDASIPVDEVSQDLLIHAKIFVFADKWLIPALKELALHKLHRDICEYHILEDEGVEVVKLLNYCFDSNVNGRDLETEYESGCNNSAFMELKELVWAYAACKSEQLLRCIQFRTLLQESGEMALQFIDTVNCRFV